MIEINIDSEYIKLDQLLKLADAVLLVDMLNF